jgi:hypothetical protein
MNNRSGAALVIAIVILAAMLLIGLPFLFTQSGSLSGTRSYAHGRLASIGQDSAQSMGVAAGASAVSYRWQQDGVTTPTGLVLDDWTDLFHDLNGADPLSGLRRVGVNRIEFDTRNHTFALPGQRYLEALPAAERDLLLQRYPTVVGLAIEDESGKLDPNHLNIRAWTRLFAAVGITDWTDGRAPQNDEGRKQLARALSVVRYQLPGGRITHLDQLLQGEPPATYGSANTPMPRPRRGLTRAELDRLRPYLTVHVPAQARGGLIDLGTVLGVEGTQVMLDHEQPQSLLAFPVVPLLTGIGTSLVVSDPEDPMVPIDQQTFVMPAIGETTRLPKTRAAVAIDAPPTINLHQAEEPVRSTFAPNALLPASAPTAANQPPVPALLTDLAKLGPGNNGLIGNDALGRPLTGFDLLSPLSVVDERGTTHVLASRLGDRGAGGPFRMADNLQYDGTEANVVLDARATDIHVITGSLDLFPPRGFARIFLNSDPSRPSEIIEYLRSDFPLPLSSDAVADLQEVILRDVRRGLNGATGLSNGSARSFPAGTDRSQYDRPADLHLTALVPHEQHPIGIASQGVITIASTATVTDPAGNQTAQDQHRVIAQAVPQESALEARWDKQAAFHALLAQRHGSLMATFPQPNLRMTGVSPQDTANVTMGSRSIPPYFPNELDASVGMKPAAMRTLLTHPHLNRNWFLSFSGSGAPALQVNNSGNTTAAGPRAATYTTADVTPEGLALAANRVLAYPNPSTGFLRDSYVTPNANNPNSGLLAPIHGRQFAIWVRPDAEWSSQVALLDMRMPTDNVSERLTGDAVPNQARDARGVNDGDAAISNRFTLVYDPKVQQLVLMLNPGNIPHVADYGPPIPRQTYGPTTGIPIKSDVWPAVNPECLGRGGVHPMASAPPKVTIQHRYHVGDRFTAGEWHLVQVAFCSNQPGGMSIIVDGLVGRDITRTPSDITAMTIPGDHLTQPVLVLATDLPTTEQVRDKGTQVLYQERIALQAITFDGGTVPLRGAEAVRRLLPERGLVRIGREYISYQSIDDTGALIDCVRGRRQRTDGGVDNNGNPNWDSAHVMEPHRVGDAVYPGGFAFTIPQNVSWYRGGCHLAQRMPDGDPAHKFQVWARVGVPLLQANSTAIPLTGGVITQFPPRGYVMIGPHQVYYDNNTVPPGDVTPPGLLNVHYYGLVTVTDPDGSTTTRNGWVSGLPASVTSTDEVVLISQEIAGADPTRPRAYAPSGFIQLYDANTAGGNAGRVEWISYSEIRSRTDFPTTPGMRVSYLINLSEETTAIVPDPDPTQPPVHVKTLRGGFWFADGRSAPFIRFGTRARERTGFAATDFTDYDATIHSFPGLTTRAIPVQTNLEIAYLLEAGDVVTLAPQVMGNGQRPIQLCVRYSADDGFPQDRNSTTATSWNSMNRHFAFSEAIPDDWNPGNTAFHLLSWPCWTPEDDLSQLNTDSEWRRDRLGWVLPWGNAYAPDFTPNNSSPANRTTLFLTTNSFGTTGATATIDAIHAGEQPGWQQGTQVQANIVPPDNTPWLGEQPLTGRLTIRTDQPVFSYPYGLIQVGGEVFAYKTDSNQDRLDAERAMNPDPVRNNQAWLIGRGLLGSTRRIHQGTELVLHLPIGPVAEVVEALPVDALGDVQLDGFFAAPAMLLSSRNGDVMELTTMPNSHTAPWLRGMYNTTPVPWTVRPNDGTFDNTSALAIGWWPRYPSAYPHDLPNQVARVQDLNKKRKNTALSAAELLILENHSALLRSRSYSWAGFPLRFHDCRFNTTQSASVQVLSNGGLFDIQALALDATLDWSASELRRVSDASLVFGSERFLTPAREDISRHLTHPGNTPRPVDGAELRVVWNYSNPIIPSTTPPAEWLQQAAQNGNRAPMIGPVYLRTRAPNKVLNVER